MKLNTKPAGSVTVTPSSGDAEVATVSGTLTFTTGDWNTAQTVTVSGVDNNVASGNGNTTVNHAVTGYGSVSSAAPVSVTVTDNDTDGVTVAPQALTVAEGETGTYTVKLNTKPTGSVTVTPSSGDAEVATVSGTLTFTTGDWNTAQTVTVSGVDNNVASGNGNTTVNHAVTGYGSVSSAAPVSVTVTDNDTDGVTVAPQALTVAEGETGTYTVKLNTKPTGSVTVTPSSGDAEVATVSGTLTFTTGDWNTAQTVTVSGVDNNVASGNGNTTVNHAVTGYGSVSSAAPVSVTVTDNDTDGVTVAPQALTVAEGETGTYTVKLNTKPAGSVTVTPSSGDAEVATVSGTLTFTTGDWNTAQTVTVSGVDNNVASGNGNTTVNHAVTGYGSVSSAAPVSVTVTDNDTDGVTVAPQALTVAEGETRTYTVKLNTKPTGSVTVTPSSGDAEVATVSGTLTFTTGDWNTAQTVTVSGVDNNVASGNGNTTVNHAVTGYGSVSSAAPVSVTVTDNDTDGVTVAPQALTVAEGETGTYTVKLNTKPAGSVTVTPSSGDAEVATVSGALTFTTGDWNTAQTVTVSGVDNNVASGNGNTTVNHAVTGYGSVSSAAPVSVTVTDNDTDGVTVAPQALTVAEGETGTYTVKLNTKPTGSVTVTPSSGDAEVATVSGTLTFTTGDWNTAQTVTVSGVDNNVASGNGNTTVNHAVTGYGSVSSAAPVSVTVTDNDTDGVTVAPQALTVAEGETGTYTVKPQALTVIRWPAGSVTVTPSKLNTKPAGSVTVTPSSGDAEVATVSGTLTFTTGDWNTAQTVTVSGVDNNVASGNGNTTVNHAVTGYGSVSSATPVSVTVTDNDTDGVTVAPQALTVAEGETRTYTVKLNTKPTGSVTVTPSSGDAEVATVSGALTFTTGDWNTAQTVTVSGVDNDVVGGDSTAQISHAVVGYGTVTAGEVSVKVTDNDTLSTRWALSTDPSTVTESSGSTMVKVTATRSGTTTANTPTTVRVSVAGGTAIAGGGGGDFLEVADFDINVVAGAASGEATFELSVIDDNIDETDETITVNGTLVDNSISGTSIIITDNETTPELSIATPTAVVEGDSGDSTMNFIVSLSGASKLEVKVNHAVDSSSTASADSDYTGGVGTLTFAAGTTQMTVAVTVVGDELDEDDETVIVSLSDPVNATIDDGMATGIIKDDDDEIELTDIRKQYIDRWLANFGRSIGHTVVELVGFNECVSDYRFQYECDFIKSEESNLIVAGHQIFAGGNEIAKRTNLLNKHLAVDMNGIGKHRLNSLSVINLPEEQHPRMRPVVLKRDVLQNSSFNLSDDNESSGRWSFWGQTNHVDFEDRYGAHYIDGKVASIALGLEHSAEHKSEGVLLLYSDGSGFYKMSNSSAGISSNVKTSMTSIHPYLRWSLKNNVQAWGTVGFGQGQIRIEETGHKDVIETDIKMSMAAFGGRLSLYSGERTNIALKGDVFGVNITTDKLTETLPEIKGDVYRVRTLLESGYEQELVNKGLLRGFIDAGVRFDRGDAQSGTGLEVGGRLRYEPENPRFMFELGGRVLLAHSEENFRNRSIYGLFRIMPNTDGQGFSMDLQPSIGNSENLVFADGNKSHPLLSKTQNPEDRVNLKLGYGLEIFGGQVFLQSSTRLELADDSIKRYGFGVDLDFGNNISLGLNSNRTRSSENGGKNSILLQWYLNW